MAGLGRGATGFTTRSDLGPARAGPSNEQIQEELAKRAAALGTAAPTSFGNTAAGKKPEEDNNDDDERFQDPENETGLFASGFYDREDDEADRIYQDVDEKMEKRRRARRLVLVYLIFIFSCHTHSYTPTCLSSLSLHSIPPTRFLHPQRTIVFINTISSTQNTDVSFLRSLGKLANKQNEKNMTAITPEYPPSSPTSNDPWLVSQKTTGQTYPIPVT